VVPHFELGEERSDGGMQVVNVSGEIHVSTAPSFREQLTEVIENGGTALVLDLSGVEFIDSTGLSVLLNGLRRLHQLNGRMALVADNPTVLRLFQITRLDSTFEIFADRESAIAHVSAPPEPA
jgi:anti-sigma B factor antagonist